MKTSKSRRRKTSKSRKPSSRVEKKSQRPAKKTLHETKPEYVDWIDPRGRVIGMIDKSFAHVHGLLHPAAHIFVIDSKDRLILQYRAGEKKIYPHHWDTSVGGHVQAGEDLTLGAERELKEELGLTTSLHFLGPMLIDAREKNYHHAERVHFYFTRVSPGARIKPNEEFEDIARVPLNEVTRFTKTRKFTPIFKQGWKKFGVTIMKACLPNGRR